VARRIAVHDPAKVVLDLAVSSALGGDCLADASLLRAEPGPFWAGRLRGTLPDRKVLYSHGRAPAAPTRS
jgi:hypothetical protein